MGVIRSGARSTESRILGDAECTTDDPEGADELLEMENLSRFIKYST